MSTICTGQPEPFVRAFVAVDVGDEVRRELAAAQAVLKKAGAHVAWTPVENIHLALAFLGNVNRETVPLIAATLDEAAGPVTPFAIEVAGVGQFGGPSAPRVIWAGVRECGDLMRLQERVASGLRALGLELEERAYRPHLTLGRVRSGRGREDLLKALRVLAGTQFGGTGVKEVVLMQSRLLPAGARYAVLHRAECGAARQKSLTQPAAGPAAPGPGQGP